MAIIGGVTVAALLIAVFLPRPKWEAAFTIPGTAYTLALDLTQSGPLLAEYDRVLSLKNAGHAVYTVGLDADSGGYKRANVYQVPGAGLVVRTFHCKAFRIDFERDRITQDDGAVSDGEVFLGSFDMVKLPNDYSEWRFLTPLEAPERTTCAEPGDSPEALRLPSNRVLQRPGLAPRR